MSFERRCICSALALIALTCVPAATAQSARTATIEAGPEISEIYLPIDPVGSVDYQAAVGAVFAINVRRYIGIDTSISITPTAPGTATSLAGGRMTQFSAGIRAGTSRGRFRIYAKLRPGFVSFGSVITGVGPAPTFQFFRGRLTEPSLDVGGIAQVDLSRRFSLRYEAGDTIIRYGSRTVRLGLPPTPPEITHNFQFGIGFMFLFH